MFLSEFQSLKKFYSRYFSRETNQVLSKVQFLKLHISSRSSIINSEHIKHVPPALAGS